MKKLFCIIVILFLFSFAYAGDIIFDGTNEIKTGSLNKGLVAHWSLSEQSVKATVPDTILADLTPNGNNGTNHGATFTTDRKGHANRAMDFDGENDYIDCGNDESLNITDAITIAVWIKTVVAGGSSNTFFVFKGPLTNNFGDYELGSNLRGTSATFYLNNHGAYLSVPITVNVWHHIVGTYDKENLRIYVNGIERNSTPYSQDIETSDTSLLLAKGYSETQPKYKGLIDDVRIYSRALSEDEIKTLYNSYRPYFIMSGE